MYEFGLPWAFAILPLPLLVWWLLPAMRQQKAALVAPFFEQLVQLSGEKPRSGSVVASRNIMQRLVRGISWLLLVAALAAPRFVGEPSLEVKLSRDMMIAVDISSSMDTRDFRRPDGTRITRFEAVVEVLDEFIGRREGDRLGLLVFGSQAYLQTPFTPDLETVRGLLNETRVGMAGMQTALGNAIGLGIQLFQADSIDTRVLILLTDGVDSGSEIPPVQAARTAARDSILIYTIGIGDPDARSSDLDEETLEMIARETGGSYFPAVDRAALEDIYRRLDELQPIEYEEASYRPETPLYYWPLAAVLLLTMLHQSVIAVFRASKKDRESP